MIPEQAVGPRIKRISNAMDRRRTLDLEGFDLTSSQGMVLGYLARHREEPVSPGDIGRHFGLTHPTVTGILQRLEAKGFLAFADDPAERRKRRVAATEKAMELHQQIVEHFWETEAQLTQGLTEAEQAQLLTLLDRLAANIHACCSGEKQIPKEGMQ